MTKQSPRSKENRVLLAWPHDSVHTPDDLATNDDDAEAGVPSLPPGSPGALSQQPAANTSITVLVRHWLLLSGNCMDLERLGQGTSARAAHGVARQIKLQQRAVAL